MAVAAAVVTAVEFGGRLHETLGVGVRRSRQQEHGGDDGGYTLHNTPTNVFLNYMDRAPIEEETENFEF